MKHAGTIALMAVVVLLAGACAGPSRGSTTSAPAELTSALDGLCRAEDLARGGDLFGARATFEDRVHGYLHELAADAQGRAPAEVGRLLEAKNVVESAFRTPGRTPDEVAARLATLEAATREVAEDLGTPAPRCGGAGG